MRLEKSVIHFLLVNLRSMGAENLKKSMNPIEVGKRLLALGNVIRNNAVQTYYGRKVLS